MYIFRITLVATMGGLLFGYDTAVVSGTIDYVQERFALSNMSLGVVVSSAIAGCMVGAALAGALSDRLGRKPRVRPWSRLSTIGTIEVPQARITPLPPPEKA